MGSATMRPAPAGSPYVVQMGTAATDSYTHMTPPTNILALNSVLDCIVIKKRLETNIQRYT